MNQPAQVARSLKSKLSADLLALSLGLFCISAQGLPVHAPVPGGVAVIDLGTTDQTPPTANWADRSLAVVRDQGRWFALLGIPLDTLPGKTPVRVSNGVVESVIHVTVSSKHYPEQRLTIKDKRKVEPNAEDQVRIEREQAITAAIKRSFSAAMPRTDFALPANGPLSSRFGLRRVFNGLPRNPHAGLDVAVGSGTPVYAPEDGVIANTGDYFYNGNTVFIDHGQGLVSASMHLSTIVVRQGQAVKKGELVGTSGATGRATGPHLHWAVFLNNTAVDPELFLRN